MPKMRQMESIKQTACAFSLKNAWNIYKRKGGNIMALPMGACPYCGKAFPIWTTKNGSRNCSGCKKIIVIQNGQVVGWR